MMSNGEISKIMMEIPARIHRKEIKFMFAKQTFVKPSLYNIVGLNKIKLSAKYLTSKREKFINK
jgi:hypothetical protein